MEIRTIITKQIKAFPLSEIKKFPGDWFSIYRNNLVIWDEDFDPRILKAIDILVKEEPYIRNFIFFESEGVLLYSGNQELQRDIEVENDYWTISKIDEI